jgi:hypothetical protein
MGRMKIVEEYYFTDNTGAIVPCNIKDHKGVDKVRLGFYESQLKQLEELLKLTVAQSYEFKSLSNNYYTPVAVMLTVSFKSELVQIDKYMKELRALVSNHIIANGREVILNYVGVKEIHEHKDLNKPKPEVHYHFVLTYCKESISIRSLKKLINGDVPNDTFKSLKRYYATHWSSGKVRLPRLSKMKVDKRGKDGNVLTRRTYNPKVKRKNSFDKNKARVIHCIVNVQKTINAAYTLKTNMNTAIQHFSYLCKVFTKEVMVDKKLVPIPEIGKVCMFSNLVQLRKSVATFNITYNVTATKQPRKNAKKIS